MIPLENVRIALQGVGSNRMRSGLTILGILIGVASVIILVAVGNGSSIAIQSRIQSLGTNLLQVQSQPVFFRAGGQTATLTQSTNLTAADVHALEQHDLNPDVAAVAPVLTASVTATWDGNSYSPSQFLGTTPPYRRIAGYRLAHGQFFSSAQLHSHARVVVVGQTVVSSLFGGQSPVGQSVQLNGATFQVIGVLAAKGTSGATNQDDVMMAPLTAVEDAITGYQASYSRIDVEAASPSRETAAEYEVATTLDTTHHIASLASGNLQILNQASLISTSTAQTFTTLLAAVAAISLLVGGIGVMNIMLVTVTERTHEIGIRKAVGARRRDLLGQFLVEAVLLAAIGGVVGVGVGLLGSHFQIVGVTPVVAPYSVALALVVSVAVGLFFGLYPASRAAGLQPIDALRHE